VEEVRFGRGAPFRIGVEEELLLVDPCTGALDGCSTRVTAACSGPGKTCREIHPALVELVTPVCEHAGAAAAVLAGMRREVLDTGVGLLGSAVHPTAPPQPPPPDDGSERYRRIKDALGDLLATPTAGLHVHVGMPDAETAIRVHNRLRVDVPLLTALAANSPFRHGLDSGHASCRAAVVRSWPRSGIPRAFRDFDDFVAAAGELARAAGASDYTEFWWELRPHPRVGTVEVRAFDTQSSLRSVAGLAALVHGLAVDAAERVAEGAPPPQDVLAESSFQASRFGLDARLVGADGSVRPARELAGEALRRASGPARALGFADELAEVERILRSGNGATRQRAAGVERALDAVRAETEASAAPCERAEPAAAPPGPVAAVAPRATAAVAPPPA
jgi:glutamate---cysteine ligase / carboxylate-amine ligase